jgi:hypothetical protein
MKRLLIGIVVFVALTAGVWGQVSLTDFQTDFGEFATAVASTLASTATSGLNWSPAYIGQFPHFGVGVTVGATLMPYSAIEPVVALLGVPIPAAALNVLQTYGVPLPAAAVDARIGGFGIPFDIGLKAGYIPPQLNLDLAGVKPEYLIAGADFRFAILKDAGFVPALSVGVGYSYMKGSISMTMTGIPSTTIDITDAMNNAGYAGTYSFEFNSPTAEFAWQSNVIEGKVQLSKHLLFLTPHVGFSAAYGISSAGGGLLAAATYSAAGPATEAQAIAVLEGLGIPLSTTQGITVMSAANGWAFRVYGGTSISLLILQLDLSATYNLLSKAYGGSVNVRFQL